MTTKLTEDYKNGARCQCQKNRIYVNWTPEEIFLVGDRKIKSCDEHKYLGLKIMQTTTLIQK